MAKYITFCEMTPEFLKLPLDDRNKIKIQATTLAQKYGIKVIFSGMPIGVIEHLVIVFEVKGNNNRFVMFQRERLGFGIPDAGKIIKNTRSVTVY